MPLDRCAAVLQTVGRAQYQRLCAAFRGVADQFARFGFARGVELLKALQRIDRTAGPVDEWLDSGATETMKSSCGRTSE